MSKLGVVVVGSGGRLGAALAREFGATCDVTGFNRARLNLESSEAIHQSLAQLEFDVLINCAALTNVDYCETHESEAMRINAFAVRDMAEACERNNARMIHISTDYVFDGQKQTSYSEIDPAIPISIYGRSKLAGEEQLRAVSARHLCVRVSWVFGPDRASFVDGIIKRAMIEERVEAIGDKWAVPSYTLDIAEYLLPMLRDLPEAGTLHICNDGRCTWQEYGQFALACAKDAGVRLKTEHVEPLKMAELLAFVAKRPVNSVMSTAKLAKLLGREPRLWQEAVRAYVNRQFANPHS